MSRNIKNVKAVNKKSRGHTVCEVSPMIYEVTSGTSGKYYAVQGHNNENRMGKSTYVTYTCSCKWGQYRSNKDAGRSGCSHVQSVVAYLEMERSERTVAAHDDSASADRARRPQINLGDGVIMTTRAAGS